VVILAPRWGAPGAAFGVFIGLFISNLVYDLFTQRKLLGGKSWLESLAPYVRIILAVAGTIALAYFLPGQVFGWLGLFIRAGIVSVLYIGLSLAVGALRASDAKYITIKAFGVIKKMSLPILSGIRR